MPLECQPRKWGDPAACDMNCGSREYWVRVLCGARRVMDKYQPLRDAGINGVNFGLDTDDIIEHLKQWDARYGIELSDIASDRVLVRFNRLPEDAMQLATDVYAFCPDTVDQHWGCIREMVELADEAGEELPDDIGELIEGVDLDDENYGLELLKRSLTKTQAVPLWWD